MKALLILVLAAGVAHADTLSQTSKKDQYWAAKQHPGRPLRKLDTARLVGKKPQPVINVYNIHTHEWIVITSKEKSIAHDEEDEFLRDHFTNQPTDMDVRLPGLLIAAARSFHVDRINVVSGFRSEKYNLMLRKKGHRVARDSQHTLGHAVDFFLPGVTTDALYDWAMKHQIGGVGKYPKDGFVHMDVGRRRTWIDK